MLVWQRLGRDSQLQLSREPADDDINTVSYSEYGGRSYGSITSCSVHTRCQLGGVIVNDCRKCDHTCPQHHSNFANITTLANLKTKKMLHK
eukprot:g83074.t1